MAATAVRSLLVCSLGRGELKLSPVITAQLCVRVLFAEHSNHDNDDARARRSPRDAMDADVSPLQRARLAYRPTLPASLATDARLLRYTVDDHRDRARSPSPYSPRPSPAPGSSPPRDGVDRAGSREPSAHTHRLAAALGPARVVDLADRDGLRGPFPHAAACHAFQVLARDASASPLDASLTTERLRPVEDDTVSGARVGVLFSGGPAPGGHNAVAGALYCLARLRESRGGAGGARRKGPRQLSGRPRARDLDGFTDGFTGGLVGFVGGPRGLLEKRWTPITPSLMSTHVNMGGFDLLGSGRMKLSSEAHFAAAAATVTDLALDGLLVIGGDDSCTNAAYLAEAFAENDVECAVVGVPKTIDDDMRGGGVEACFGFDSASKGAFYTLVPIRPQTPW